MRRRRLVTHPANGFLTAAIDRLEGRRLLQTTTDPADPRVRTTRLTPRGRRLIEAAFAQHAREMMETAAVLNPDERRDLVRLLRKSAHPGRLVTPAAPSRNAGRSRAGEPAHDQLAAPR